MPFDPALEAELTRLIRLSTGSEGRIERLTAVGGGSISQAFRLSTADTHWFLKLNRAERYDLFAAEANGLDALRRCASIRIPKVVALGTLGKSAYLLLEYVDLHPLRESTASRNAGLALADLHRIEGRRFGWPRDNFIGSTPQGNAEENDWPRYFARQRLMPQLALAQKAGVDRRLVASGERLAEKLAALFVGYTPIASLLHGDLWSGNAASDDAGKLTLFDPAVYFGDRESDLAMMELFGGFPARLRAAYVGVWPLAHGHEPRKVLYQLYHVLNHMNLFGSGYQSQAERMIGRLLAEIG